MGFWIQILGFRPLDPTQIGLKFQDFLCLNISVHEEFEWVELPNMFIKDESLFFACFVGLVDGSKPLRCQQEPCEDLADDDDLPEKEEEILASSEISQDFLRCPPKKSQSFISSFFDTEDSKYK